MSPEACTPAPSRTGMNITQARLSSLLLGSLAIYRRSGTAGAPTGSCTGASTGHSSDERVDALIDLVLAARYSRPAWRSPDGGVRTYSCGTETRVRRFRPDERAFIYRFAGSMHPLKVPALG